MADLTEQSTVSVRLVLTIVSALVGVFLAVTPGILATAQGNQTAMDLRALALRVETNKAEAQAAIQAVEKEQVRAKEQTISIVDGLRRVEAQLQQSTVIRRASGTGQ